MRGGFSDLPIPSRSQIGSDADHSTVSGLLRREARDILEYLQYTAGAADHHTL